MSGRQEEQLSLPMFESGNYLMFYVGGE